AQTVSPSANIIVDHVAAKASNEGISFDTSLAGAGATTTVAIANSVASNNSSFGIVAEPHGLPMTVAVDSTVVSGNTTDGVVGGSSVHVLLGRSVITGNGAGVRNQTGPNANTFYSYGNNQINGNTIDIATGAGTSSLVVIPTQ